MTNEEKAKEIASKYERWNIEEDESDGAYKGALEMAAWKERQIIEKAIEWLKKNADSYTWYNEFEGESGMIEEFIEDFKKAMEADE